jgi:hypothetical protein
MRSFFNLFKPGILKKHSNLKKTFSKPCVVDGNLTWILVITFLFYIIVWIDMANL